MGILALLLLVCVAACLAEDCKGDDCKKEAKANRGNPGIDERRGGGRGGGGRGGGSRGGSRSGSRSGSRTGSRGGGGSGSAGRSSYSIQGVIISMAVLLVIFIMGV